MFLVERDIPLPSSLGGRHDELKKTCNSLRCGESFLVQAEDYTPRLTNFISDIRLQVYNCSRQYIQFKTSKISDTEIRIWRVK